MTNRFEQSSPPSIHDVYRGLPIGPGGIAPFIYRDRGPRTRPPARLPWRAVGTLVRRIVDLFAGTGREQRQPSAALPSAVCCQRA